jgi:hypothetical protein
MMMRWGLAQALLEMAVAADSLWKILMQVRQESSQRHCCSSHCDLLLQFQQPLHVPATPNIRIFVQHPFAGCCPHRPHPYTTPFYSAIIKSTQSHAHLGHVRSQALLDSLRLSPLPFLPGFALHPVPSLPP